MLNHLKEEKKRLYVSVVSLFSLAFRWQCAEKRERGGEGAGERKKMSASLDAVSMPAGGKRCNIFAQFKNTDCSGSRSIFSSVCAICGRVTWGLSFPELTVYSESWQGADVAWDGCSCSPPPPAVSMQCGWLLVIVTHCRFSRSLHLRSKQMRCQGFTKMCTGMWGVSMVRISGTPQNVTTQHKLGKKLSYCTPTLPGYQVP